MIGDLKPDRLGGLILAGGQSRRMGAPKGAIDYHGVSQAANLHQALSRVCDPVFVAVPTAMSGASWLAGLPVLLDAEGIGGPMAALLGAFGHLETAWFAVAVDMPLLDASAIARLVEHREPDADATAYRASDGAPEPLCCIYEVALGQQIINAGARGQSSLRSVLRAANVAMIDADPAGLTTSVDSVADQVLLKGAQT
jgi:molybdenum cofactor guanylyltransferase